jgi:hemerythrin
MDFDFEWKEEYSTGIDEIDRQHKELLSMIEKIYNIGQNILEKDYVDQLLKELVIKLHEHFDCEEELMKKYNYPKLDDQIQQHKQIYENIQQQIVEVRKEQFRLLQLLFHLGRWFVDHDNKFDKELGKYIKSVS